MKQISKIIAIPVGATIAQMEAALDLLIKNSWELKQIFPLGTQTYAVFIKTVSS